MDLIGPLIAAVVVTLASALVLDFVHGIPKRATGRMTRTLQRIPDEQLRERWNEEFRRALLECEGRPLRQLRESRELLRAADVLAAFYLSNPMREPEAISAESDPTLEVVQLEAVSFKTASAEMDRETLKEALANLSYRERRVLELRFGLGGQKPHSRDVVGRMFAIGADRIEVIERMSLKKLQQLAEVQKLREIA